MIEGKKMMEMMRSDRFSDEEHESVLGVTAEHELDTAVLEGLPVADVHYDVAVAVQGNTCNQLQTK